MPPTATINTPEKSDGASDGDGPGLGTAHCCISPVTAKGVGGAGGPRSVPEGQGFDLQHVKDLGSHRVSVNVPLDVSERRGMTTPRSSGQRTVSFDRYAAVMYFSSGPPRTLCSRTL